MRTFLAGIAVVGAGLFIAEACSSNKASTTGTGSTTSGSTSSGAGGGGGATPGIESIKHIIVIMQENRSFDHYFGTFPGADGIPMDANGVPTVCAPDPMTGMCVKPYHDPTDSNAGGPHGSPIAIADFDNGMMDGFFKEQEAASKNCTPVQSPQCTGAAQNDVMGYKTEADIPNYWAYAKTFTLQDHMFEPNASWSLPAHLFLVSEWSALCTTAGDPMSCHSDIDLNINLAGSYDYAWTDITYLLHKAGVSWKYYLAEGSEPDWNKTRWIVRPSCRPPRSRASGTRFRSSTP